MEKIIGYVLVILVAILTLIYTVDKKPANVISEDLDTIDEEETTILLAAAASLKNVLDDKLIPLFEKKYPNIKVDVTYDSSGKLQSQIEEGADVDIFMSAAMKQMNTLDEQDLILEDSIVELLENKIVLIVSKGSQSNIGSFEAILEAERIAVGDPKSVPAGQYAQEAFTKLSIWDQVLEKASLGTNVTQVLNWVAEGSADAGIVYSTDAASHEKVQVVAEAPEGSVSKIIYPVGLVKATRNKDAANTFKEFLQSEETSIIFKSYGFTTN